MKNKKLLTEIDRTRELMGVITIKENLNYKDISDLSDLNIGQLKSDKYFILHHTAGRGNAEKVVQVLNNRTIDGKKVVLGVQWVIDRDGRIYQTLPLGAKGQHIKNANMSGVPQDISNSTAQGVEIIGNDDSDMLPIQCLSALKLVKDLGYSLGQIYGHGEVNKHKARNEGKTCKAFINKHWSDSISELEKEIGTYSFPDLPEEKPLKKNKKSTTSSDNKKSKDVDMNKEKDDDTSIFDIEGAIKKRFEKAGSQIEKLTQNLFK
jgi:hypothetical protein